MDNRVNEYRGKISVLRQAMGEVEAAMRAAVARDLDCSSAAARLMELRAEVAELARLRTSLGDIAPIGTTDIRKPRFARG
jgi:hypothetical protein